MEKQSGQRRLIDPHFHLWDLRPETNPGAHNPTWLGTPGATYSPYVEEHYLEDMKQVPESFRFEGAVFVEALSDDPVKEAAWNQAIADQAKDKWLKAMVAYAYLPSLDIDAQLAALSRYPIVKGIRQIINHHPDNPDLIWPKVHSGRYLIDDEQFRHGYSLLEKYSLSFDLQVNPHQLRDAANFVSQFKNIPVVLNHIGCVLLKNCSAEQEAERIGVWREGMQALAQQPHVFVKLSQFCFALDGWHQKDSRAEQVIKSLVKETIGMFGPERCMFASNFPVDKLSLSTKDMYARMLAWTEEWGLDEKAKDDLFYSTAATFYRIHPS